MIDNKLIPNEPDHFDEKFLEQLLDYMHKIGAADLFLSADDFVMCNLHGFKVRLTEKVLNVYHLELFAKIIFGDDAKNRLNSAEALDKDFEIKTFNDKDELIILRYRVNITAIRVNGSTSFQITIREIPYNIPDLDKIGLSRDHYIFKNFFPLQGLVLVTGPTGSGKSTLMASCLKELLQEDSNKIIHTYESPIEFVYDQVKKTSSRIYQSSVPYDIKTFSLGIRASLRRAPEIIMVGELRDRETIEAALEACQTGHLVIGTTHTNGVPATIRRLINAFQPEERESRQADLIESLNFIVSQRLLKTTDGKRCAVREYLKFDVSVKERLMKTNPLKINLETRYILEEQGIGMLIDAEEKFKQGIILESDYLELKNTFGLEK